MVEGVTFGSGGGLDEVSRAIGNEDPLMDSIVYICEFPAGFLYHLYQKSF